MMAGVGLLLMLWCWCRCRDVGAELELVQFLMDEADSRCNYLFVVSLNWRERERERRCYLIVQRTWIGILDAFQRVDTEFQLV